MNRMIILFFCISLLTGCVRPKQEVVVIKQNRFFRCESDPAIRKTMVDLVNRARAKKRDCGSSKCNPVRPIRWNAKLAQAALAHSRDMAKNDFFDHTGSNGKTVAARVNSSGYSWRSVGENICAGRETSAAAVAGWLTSPGHCRNIMSAGFTEIGAACFCNPDSEFGTYWTLVLASPRQTP
jgi:uncharacterized protein YkwD